MGGFVVGAGGTILIAAACHLVLVEFGVSTFRWRAVASVRFERCVDHESATHDGDRT